MKRIKRFNKFLNVYVAAIFLLCSLMNLLYARQIYHITEDKLRAKKQLQENLISQYAEISLKYDSLHSSQNLKKLKDKYYPEYSYINLDKVVEVDLSNQID